MALGLPNRFSGGRVTFRLGRVVSGKRVTFAFSGELTQKELTEIAAIIVREESGPIVFDLTDLTMASREGIEYLRDAAADGAELVNCPPYIGRWIEAEE
jgi:hypothetical protein